MLRSTSAAISYRLAFLIISCRRASGVASLAGDARTCTCFEGHSMRSNRGGDPAHSFNSLHSIPIHVRVFKMCSCMCESLDMSLTYTTQPGWPSHGRPCRGLSGSTGRFQPLRMTELGSLNLSLSLDLGFEQAAVSTDQDSVTGFRGCRL